MPACRRPRISRDMCHMRGKQLHGVMVDMVMQDGLKRTHPLVIGRMTDSENFQSWLMADKFVTAEVPEVDGKDVAHTADGQKGGVRSMMQPGVVGRRERACCLHVLTIPLSILNDLRFHSRF